MDHLSGHLLDLTLADLNSGKLQVTETWEVGLPAFRDKASQDTFTIRLKHMETLTMTEITIDEVTKQVSVSGKDTATVKLALDRLSNLNTVLAHIERFQENSFHHIFPPKAYNLLQMIPFESHPAATTLYTLTTEQERDALSSMVVLVPLKPGSRKQAMPTTPCQSSSVSRYWERYEIQGFDNREAFQGSSSGSVSSVSRDFTIPLSSNDLTRLGPERTFPLTAPEKADRVKEWVDRSAPSEAATASLLDSIDIEMLQPMSGEKPAEEPKPSEEPKKIRGILKRRPRPKCHSTMAQKTAPGSSSNVKQITLDDCWRNAFASFKLKAKQNQDDNHQNPSTAKSKESVAVPLKEVIEAPKLSVKTNRRGDAHEVGEIFKAMQPALEIAKSFPGALELGFHVELIAVSPFSDYRQTKTAEITIDDWKEAFQPDTTRLQSSFWLWNKLTASGADVDSIVDLRWSKKGPEKIFEEEPADQGIAYEFHCRMRNGFVFVITLDEKGKPTFQEAESVLGSSTIHFPHRTWDLNLILKGSMNLFHKCQDKNLNAAIGDFVKSILLQPGDNLIIYCTQPDGIFSVDKILMKRWTRHTHLPHNQEKSNLMLKILEVQEFVIGRNSNCPRMIRARIPLLEREEWALNQRLWFEVSIVSDDIQKLLASNRDLELGQQTQKWNPVDLLGDEIELKDISLESSQVAGAIGNSGLGNMFRLGKTVLERMRIGE